MFILFSLLAIACYAYSMATLLLIRQDTYLLNAAVFGGLSFAIAAFAALKHGHRILCVLHGIVSAVATLLLIALLIM
ncbi:MAG: hypothetical protein J5803_04540 [Desulfovibrio sp.]|nr:hypothetical protein [Desulfovibrio sp.]